jgi:hypothetical protein
MLRETVVCDGWRCSRRTNCPLCAAGYVWPIVVPNQAGMPEWDCPVCVLEAQEGAAGIFCPTCFDSFKPGHCLCCGFNDADFQGACRLWLPRDPPDQCVL